MAGEPDALAELTFDSKWADPAPGTRSTIYRFRFPPQDHPIRPGSNPRDPETEKSVGTVYYLDDAQGVIDIRRGNNQPAPNARLLIPFDFFNPRPKQESLQRLARWVVQNGIDNPGQFKATRDLLTRRPPNFKVPPGQPLRLAGEEVADAARRLVSSIDNSYLAIQGPPGSGKSTVGAEMIVDLVAAGHRIGVTANSHKVIGELLAKVAEAAANRGVNVTIGQRSTEAPTFGDAVHLKDNNAARNTLHASSIDMAGGTTWLWSSDDMIDSVDVLFIDEAGQMSLADTAAASV